MSIDYFPIGRIKKGTSVFYHHRGPHGSTLIEGKVSKWYGGSGRYGVETSRGERTPLASVLERANRDAPRVA